MGLFSKSACENEFISFIKKALSSSPAGLWEEYKAITARLKDSEEAFNCEHNIRIDTEKRCSELYQKLSEAQKKILQLNMENKAQADSIENLKNTVASLQSVITAKNSSLARLARMCFGKKSEKLKKCLGKKGFGILSSFLKLHAPESFLSCRETAEGNNSRTDEGDSQKKTSGSAGSSEDPSGSCVRTSEESSGQPDGSRKNGENCDGDSPEEETGKGNGKTGTAGGGRKNKGNRNLSRRSGFLDSYCDPADGCVFEIQDFHYTEDEIITILNHDGSANRINISPNISTYQTLEYIPGFYYMKTHVVPSLKSGDTLLRAPRLDRILNASAASPSVLSHAAFWKYRQGLPVNAISSHAVSEGAKIERGTMSGWLSRGYEKLLFPMHMALLQYVKKRSMLMGDETYTYARDEKRDLHTCYFWGIRTSPLDGDPNQAVFFVFDNSRMSLVPSFYLHGYIGKFLTDGYVGYEVLDESDGSIIRCCCWVHGRRTVVEVLPGSKALEDCPEEVKEKIWAWQALCTFSEMFSLEKSYRDMDVPTRTKRRQEEMAPLVDQFFELAGKLSSSSTFDSGSEEGKAIRYFLSRETELRRMLEDGAVPLSTNDLERCNIIVALVRKRAKIFDSEAGASSAAGYFTLIETAEANGKDAESYLEFLFDVMPSLLYEHRTEIENYLDYYNAARKRLEAAKEMKRKNPSARVEIDWSGLEEPDLSFLMVAAPWAEAFRIYTERNGKAVHRKEIIEMLTRQNLMNSPLSPEILDRIIHTEKNLADSKLDGLREILDPMILQQAFGNQKDKYENGLVNGIITHKSHLPERLIEEAGQFPGTAAPGHGSSNDAGLSGGTGGSCTYGKPPGPSGHALPPDTGGCNKAGAAAKACSCPPGQPFAEAATA